MADLPVPGVRGLDHTADLGVEVEAPTLEALLSRAAFAMEWLLRGAVTHGAIEGLGDGEAREDGGEGRDREGGTDEGGDDDDGDHDARAPSRVRVLDVESRDAPALLRRFLQELLLLLEGEDRALEDVRVDEAAAPADGPARARARITLAPSADPPLREIKGVTWHGLAAEQRNGGWWGRVVFDV